MTKEARVIAVDKNGRDANGNTFEHVASGKMVRGGYLLNEQVVLRFPDGSTKTATEVRFTAKGLTQFARILSPMLKHH